MKLLIDSNPTELPSDAATSFSHCCAAILEILLQHNLFILSCNLDGETVTSVKDGDQRFSEESLIEVYTSPLHPILHTAIHQQCSEIENLESHCGELVTESLIGEPAAILERWQAFCEKLKEQVHQIPSLCGLLGQTEAEDLTDNRLETLSATMKSCGESLSRADVVTFSDTLELQLIPWLRQFKQLVQNALANLDQIPAAPTT